jgi:tRNA pseudouridine55 synthase
LTGALLIDKPAGPTSHDVVAFVRRLLGTSRVGHTGTLDPLASGLLVLLIGPATRLAQFLVADEKEYIADVRLGIATPTYDAQSLEEARRQESFRPKPEATQLSPHEQSGFRVQAEELTRALANFAGTFAQLPPPFSAKKVAGVRAYAKARRNEPVELKPVDVTVHELEVLPAPTSSAQAQAGDLVRLRIVCSSGFYVRSLAHDLGQALGCGAYLEGLRRTRVGRFRIDDAAPLNELQAAGADAAARLIGVDSLLADFPAVSLTEEGLRRAANGNSLAPQHVQTGAPLPGAGIRVRVRGAAGEVLAVAEGRPDGLLHPLLVLR